MLLSSVTAGWRAANTLDFSFLQAQRVFFCFVWVRACLRVCHMLFFHVNWKHMHLCCITLVFTSSGSGVAAICECISSSVRAPGLRGLFCFALALFSFSCSVFLACGFARASATPDPIVTARRVKDAPLISVSLGLSDFSLLRFR